MPKACVLVIQVDTRARRLYAESKRLFFPEHSDTPESILKLNGYLSNKWNYWSLSSLLNELRCKELGWTYEYRHVSPPPDRHVAWTKIGTIVELLMSSSGQTYPYDLFVTIDTDAWIRDSRRLKSISEDFIRSDKFLLIGGDPKLPKNTAVNTGFMMGRSCKKTLDFFLDVWSTPVIDSEYQVFLQKWPYEQKVADFLLKQEKYRDAFVTMDINLVNTPCGEIIRHCWWKDLSYELMVDEMLAIGCKSLRTIQEEEVKDSAL